MVSDVSKAPTIKPVRANMNKLKNDAVSVQAGIESHMVASNYNGAALEVMVDKLVTVAERLLRR
jgi:hypothetical protein